MVEKVVVVNCHVQQKVKVGIDAAIASGYQVVQNLMFLHPKFEGRAPYNLWGTFVNRHHFRPTDQIWLRSHGRSFIYVDEIKKNTAIKYNGPVFGSNNKSVTTFDTFESVV